MVDGSWWMVDGGTEELRELEIGRLRCGGYEVRKFGDASDYFFCLMMHRIFRNFGVATVLIRR